MAHFYFFNIVSKWRIFKKVSVTCFLERFEGEKVCSGVGFVLRTTSVSPLDRDKDTLSLTRKNGSPFSRMGSVSRGGISGFVSDSKG